METSALAATADLAPLRMSYPAQRIGSIQRIEILLPYSVAPIMTSPTGNYISLSERSQ